ncbi:hypothetical protein [Arundinibacter roseus]|uniref:Uncharacterized protein n=1 Tax=Arundinibacter roseus TaxID=2070510 RepID=A0A4R4KC78_9BACT|nr:hypothetical protein [Arundinibacter roseus]TDB64352.1 hypothetical protein EZE20_11760 [Arundinibacter roseus]
MHRIQTQANENLREENRSLRNELRFTNLLRLLEKRSFEGAFENEKKKRKWILWRGRAEGFAAGLLVPFP